MIKHMIACVGASAGGVSALQKLLGRITSAENLSLVIVQHLPEDAEIDSPLVFGSHFVGRIFDVCDKMPIEPGAAYFAAPGYHLMIEREGIISLSQDEPVNFSRPSIDVLFESAANTLGDLACGVLLTGANTDGTNGMKCIQRVGGKTIVQDPDEAEVPYMPASALAEMKPDFVLKLEGIAEKLLDFARRKNEND
jgi:two-component system chemotaxis response regulator CheB